MEQLSQRVPETYAVCNRPGSPANAAWLCLNIFEHLVMLNYPVSPQSSNQEQCKSITEDDQDIVNYTGGSVVQKIKQKTFQQIQTVSRTEKLECLQHITRTGSVDEDVQDAEVSLTSTLSRGGLITLNKNAEHFFQLLEVRVREVLFKH